MSPDNDFPCELCTSLNANPPAPRSFFESLFHNHCPECSVSELNEDPNLCGICRHVRISHLIACENWKSCSEWPELELGALRELQNRASTCHLCRFLSNTIVTAATPTSVDAENMRDHTITIQKLHVAKVYCYCGTFPVPIKAWRRPLPSTESKSSRITKERCPPPVLSRAYCRGSYLDTPVPPSSPPVLQEHVDWDIVKTWLQPLPEENLDGHPSRWLPGFRLIDVQKNLLVNSHIDSEYAALSYVFGGVKPDALPPSGLIDTDLLPVTICAAMAACVGLGIKYLWVDQICINQNDPNDLEQQISQMHRIYGSATCTLVALEGTSSHHGLPGVSHPRLWNHERIEIGNVVLADRSPMLSTLITHSKWYTRGWTFQETVLSSQLLFFTEYGVYYQSQIGERLHEESESSSMSRVSNTYSMLFNYWTTLEEYTKRDLTYGTDALRAFAGVLHAKHGTATYYGMPISEVDLAMLWYEGNKDDHFVVYRLESAYYRFRGQRDNFPSWSWSSYTGPIHHLEEYCSLALWAVPDSERNTKFRVCEPVQGREWIGALAIDAGRPYMKLIMAFWLAGCIRSIPPRGDSMENLHHRWPTYDVYWHEAFDSYEDYCPFSPGDLRTAESSTGCLLVHTQIARFRIKPLKISFRNEHRDKFWIRSSEGLLVGAVRVPLHSQSLVAGGMVEFLSLSIGKVDNLDLAWVMECPEVRPGYDEATDQVDDEQVCDALQSIYLDKNLRKYEQSVPFDMMVLNVMLILRGPDAKVACRLGVGQIFLKDWIGASPQFHTVILQ